MAPEPRDELPGLTSFGEALVAAARADTARPRRVPHGLSMVLAVILGLLTTAAATAVVLRSTVIDTPDARLIAPDQTPLERTAVLTSPRADDPAGGPPWALRLTRTATGQTCTTVGQVRDGEFGIVGYDGVFRVIPAAIADACGRGLLLGSRIVSAPDQRETRSIVYGVAGDDVREVVLTTTTAPRRLALGEHGSFIAALPGFPEDTAAVVEIVHADGRRERRSLGAQPSLVPDLGGAPAWRMQRLALGTRMFCVGLRDARGPATRDTSDPNGGRATTPTACVSRRGRARWAALAVTLRPGQTGVPGFDRWEYKRRPARTIVLGITRDPGSITHVTVGAAGQRPRAVVPARNGAFAVVLPAGVRPSAVRLRVRLRGGVVQLGRSGHGVVPDVVASRRAR